MIFHLTLACKGPQEKEKILGRRDIFKSASVYTKKPLEYQLRVSKGLGVRRAVASTTAYLGDVTESCAPRCGVDSSCPFLFPFTPFSHNPV